MVGSLPGAEKLKWLQNWKMLPGLHGSTAARQTLINGNPSPESFMASQMQPSSRSADYKGHWLSLRCFYERTSVGVISEQKPLSFSTFIASVPNNPPSTPSLFFKLPFLVGLQDYFNHPIQSETLLADVPTTVHISTTDNLI